MSSPEIAHDPQSVASVQPRGERHRLLGVDLVFSELTVLFRRRRSIAMLVAVALIPVLLAVAVALTAQELAPGEGPPFLDRVTQNGLFVGFAAMIIAIPLFLPLTVGVVAGDTIAGEASQGTLRYLLVAPAGRLRLLVVKFIGTVAWALAATLTLMVSGLIIGSILFPVGPVTLLSGDVVGLGESLSRVMLVALYASISLVGLSAVGLFISTLTDVPVGAMAATVIVPIVSQILDALPQLSAVHPYLLTHYWLGFADLLRNPIEWSSFTSNALLQLGYIVVFGSLAYSRFATKSILS
jgi:ABC-2 type transport system permease protein